MSTCNDAFHGRTVGEYMDWARSRAPKGDDRSPASRMTMNPMPSVETLFAALEPFGRYGYPAMANGTKEDVIAFNNDEFIQLITDRPEGPHFSSKGVLTSLHHEEIPGSKVFATFPVNPADIGLALVWPPRQQPPWDHPPVDATNATAPLSSKQFYSFNCDADHFITVGPSLPKLTPLKGGGAQFWVGSIGVVTQGKGKFEGARGVSTYVGSGLLDDWPDNPEAQIERLKKGFNARIGTILKYVRRDYLDAPHYPCPPKNPCCED